VISHSIPEIQCTSGLQSAILKYVSVDVRLCRTTSDKVGSVTTDSGVVENVGVAVGISMISHSVPVKHSTSGLWSAILKYGGLRRCAMSRNVIIITNASGMVKNIWTVEGILFIE
jgi:hypothetical protein